KFNAEIHSQATLEGLKDLRHQHAFDPADIASIELNTFDVAYHIIGGGEEGGKKNIRTKEEADHSLPYMMAAVLLDRNVLPSQYLPERIQKSDIQELLQKVQVNEDKNYSDRFPVEMANDISIKFKDGKVLKVTKTDYEGFTSRPAFWEFIISKFKNLSQTFISQELQTDIIKTVQNLENHTIKDLTKLLAKVARPEMEEVY